MTNDKDSAVLEPCPFCGSANIDPEGWGSENSSGPACDDCGASAGSTVASTPEENIAAWNTRQPTQSDALKAENERLRALLARTVNLAEVYAEGTGTNFKETMAEARAALQEQSK